MTSPESERKDQRLPEEAGDSPDFANTIITWLEEPAKVTDPSEVVAPELDGFEVLKPISAGGMGVLWQAKQISMNKLVALKVLNASHCDSTAMMRFQQEAKTLSRLSHPDIATVYDFGISKDGKQPFMAIEFIEGETLKEILRERHRLPLDEALPIFIRVCRALGYAHDKDIIHRDVQPANIMLSKSEDGGMKVKLIDFGIAKSIDFESSGGQLTKHGNWIGSPLYMSPEQSRGDQVSKQSDMYGLGCVMFHCFSGRVPFEGVTILDTISMHQEAPPPVLSEVAPDADLPPALDEVLSRLMAKQPEERFDSMEEVAQILEGLISRREYAKSSLKKLLTAVSLIMLLLVASAIAYGVKVKNDTTINSPWSEKVSAATKSGAVELKLNNRAVNDYQLSLLNNNPTIEKLDLTSASVTDDGLRFLNGKNLRSVILDGTKIKKLDRLACRSSLEELTLRRTQVNDESIKSLSSFTKLGFLDVSSTDVSLRGIESISACPLRSVVIREPDEETLKRTMEKLQFCNFNQHVSFAKSLLLDSIDRIKAGQTLEAIKQWRYWIRVADSKKATSFSIYCRGCLAGFLDQVGKTDEAEQYWSEAIRLGKQTGDSFQLADVYGAYFKDLIEIERFDKAVEIGWAAIANYKNALGEDYQLALDAEQTAQALQGKRRFKDSLEFLNESLAIQQRLVKAPHAARKSHQFDYTKKAMQLQLHSGTLVLMADAQCKLKDFDSARKTIEKSNSEFEDLIKLDPSPRNRANMVFAKVVQAEIELAAGNLEKAMRLRDEMTDMSQRLRVGDRIVSMRALQLHCDILKASGKTDEARYFERKIEALKKQSQREKKKIQTSEHAQ